MNHKSLMEPTVSYGADTEGVPVIKSSKQDLYTGREGAFLWTDGLICAFEFARESSGTTTEKHSMKPQPMHSDNKNLRRQVTGPVPSHPLAENLNDNSTLRGVQPLKVLANSPITVGSVDGRYAPCHWIPIGWARISELLQISPVDAKWSLCDLPLDSYWSLCALQTAQQVALMNDDFHAASVVDPSCELSEGPIWWCHVSASHLSIIKWLHNAHWLDPKISILLRDKGKLISECMKYLHYEVPVRIAGGLLFEMLVQLVGDPFCNEDDIPIAIRFWKTQKFLITVMHIEDFASNINVLGINEVQDLLFAGGSSAPKSIHEVVAYLTCHFSQWEDRQFRKFVFDAANKIELKFVNRKKYEDLNLLSTILIEEIKRLAKQVFRVNWLLHIREEIVLELLKHLRGTTTRILLDGVIKGTREILEEQEVVRGKLFTLQNTILARLEDKSPRIPPNLAILGSCGLFLSLIASLFGINVYAFAIFFGVIFFIGILFIGLDQLVLGLKKHTTEEYAGFLDLQ